MLTHCTNLGSSINADVGDMFPLDVRVYVIGKMSYEFLLEMYPLTLDYGCLVLTIFAHCLLTLIPR